MTHPIQSEDLKLATPPREFATNVPVYAIEAVIDALVPRGGGPPPEDVVVQLEEYLARLGSLSRKCFGVQYRKEQWMQIAGAHRDRVSAFALSIPGDLPDGATAVVEVSFWDGRVDSEFESLLFSIRSGLDMLARVVAAHLPGKAQVKSYNDLRKAMPASHSVKPLIEEAFASWAADLRARRDAGAHYVGLTARSRFRATSTAKQVEQSESTVQVPAEPTNKSLSIWEYDVPVARGSSHSSVHIEQPDFARAEAHGIFDADGVLILRHNGPLPQRQQMVDGFALGIRYADSFAKHVIDTLTVLRAARTS